MIKDLQTGRSMLEMLGVLAIVGVLTVGGFGLVNKVNNSNQSNSVIDEVSSLAAKVRIVARDYSSGDGGFMQYVCKGKAYPDTMECEQADGSSGGDCNCSSFTGSSDVSYTVATASYPALFKLTASNLTEEMCMSLLTTNWGNESTTGFRGISGAGNSSGSTSNDAIAKAAAACNGDSNSLTLEFR